MDPEFMSVMDEIMQLTRYVFETNNELTVSMSGTGSAETSTGALQPLQEIGEIVENYDALFIVDAVTSLGGSSVNIDANKVDACYSGTQKCLSVPPGLSPITFSERAVEVMENKNEKVQSWYLDLSMIRNYWGNDRTYHHTALISMNYALHEGLRIIQEEGLENTFQRHSTLGTALHQGLEAMGINASCR